MAVSYKTVKVGETSGYWDPLEVWSPSRGGISMGEIERHNNAVSVGATAANAAKAYNAEAEAYLGSMLSNAQAGLAEIQGLGGQSQADIQASRDAAEKISPAISNVNTQAGLLNNQAELINQQAGNIGDAAAKVGATADTVENEANALKPYADQLTQYASQLWNEGSSVFGEGSGLVDMGNQLLNLDENAGGLMGQYIKSLKGLDPRRYVAQAAADVQGSFDNAKGQLTRELSRSGATLSSGAAQAQKRLLAQTYAATLAGAKTRAWQAGANEQLTANRNALSDAMDIIKQGTDTQTAGANIQKAGASTETDAATVQKGVVEGVTAAGQLRKQAGDLEAEKAGALSQAASAQGKAGDLYASAGDLAAKQANAYSATVSSNTGYLNALNAAYGNVTEAYKNYTEFMSSQASGFAQLAAQNGFAAV